MKQLLCILSLLTALTTACQMGGEDTFKPSVTGRNGEVLIVINDDVKADTSGRYLREMLTEPFLGLPSIEPIFDVQTVPHGYFDKPMHSFRNIVYVEVADTISASGVRCYADVWAKQQAVVYARARTKAELLQMLDENAIKIISFITKSERDRLIRFNTRTRHIPLSQSIEKQWGIDLVVPNTYSACKPADAKNCSWVSIDSDEFQAGIFIYSYPYDGARSLEKEYIVAKRDSVLRRNAEGPNGAHMTTETRFGMDELICKTAMQNDIIVSEVRGLWRMDSFAMGGPFVLRAYFDDANNRVVVTDGYVYYPAKDRKRNLIRQLEAVMYTLKFKNDKTQE